MSTIHNTTDQDPEEESPTRWVGIDVSKKSLDVHSKGLKKQPVKKVTNDAAGHRKLAEKLAALGRVHVVFEASGGYEEDLLLFLQGEGINCSRVNPGHVRSFAKAQGILVKTDAVDAVVIADFGAFMAPEPTPEASPALSELRALLSYREHLMTDLGREKMFLEHRQPKCLEVKIKRRITTLKANIRKIEQEIASHAKAHQEIGEAADVLSETKGVGQITALSLLAGMPELGTVGRNQAGALSGLAPFNCDSGEMRGRRRIYGGRVRIRKALYMAAVVASRHNEDLSEFFQRLISKGKPYKVAITAVMRRLLVHLNSVMRKHLEEVETRKMATD